MKQENSSILSVYRRFFVENNQLSVEKTNKTLASPLDVGGKVLFILFGLLFSFGYGQTVWFDGSTTNKEWYTKNTSADTFYIETAGDLAGLRELMPNNTSNPNFTGKTIILMNDIQLNDTKDWTDWTDTKPSNVIAWLPIAAASSTSYGFKGTFDGNGHTISGIYITGTAANQGLFGNAYGAIIKNLGIKNSYIKGGNLTGGIVGKNSGKVWNSFVIDSKIVSTGTSNYAGGLVGQNVGAGSEVINCYFAGQVRQPTDETYTDYDEYDNEFTVTVPVILVNGGAIVGQQNAGANVSSSYYDITASVAKKAIGTNGGILDKDNGRTTQEMQSQDFADILNNTAGFAFTTPMNKWKFNGGYPILLHGETAENLFENKFASGDGKTNPFIIENVQQLKNLAEIADKVNLEDLSFKLANDIVFSPEDNHFTAIGTSDKPFNGNFEGSGFVISGISTEQTHSYQGLFGYIGSNGTVKNVGLINSDIKGQNYVGGIAGYNAGTISNSYSTAKVSGNNYVGGFVGYNAGSIAVAYSAGTVTGATNVGGFVGSNYEFGKIIGAYYQTPNPIDPAGTEGIGADEMKGEGFVRYLNNFATILSTKKWVIGGEANDGYPVLDDGTLAYNIASYFDGSGTESNPYSISIPKHLDYLSLLVGSGKDFNGKYFRLSNDIQLNPSKNFTPIGTLNSVTTNGNQGIPFQGTFDGDGKTINGLYIINSDANYGIGLFGYVSNGGKIKNLKITEAYVKGKRFIGGLVGTLEGNNTLVDNCSFSGTVTATTIINDGLRGARAGGLVGYNDKAKIKNSHSTGYVNVSEDYVGGLVGYNTSGQIENSHSSSNVTGKDYVGGLVGRSFNSWSNKTQDNTIDKSYSTGTVTGNDIVGGLLGEEADHPDYSKNFSTSDVKGKNNVGGLIGIGIGATGDFRINDSYATGDVKGEKNIGGLAGRVKVVNNSYSVGKVTGDSELGGLIGYLNSGGKITNSYYNNTINSFNDPFEGGRTEAQLKQKETFTDWDFENIWKIDDNKVLNKGYPYLIGVGEDMLKCVAEGKHWGDGCQEKIEVKPSSSSAAITPQPSSSSAITPQPSSSSVSSSSVFVKPEIVSCDGFVEGTTREHFGRRKKQICDQRDGTRYVYVTIGDQDWMAENLNYAYDHQCEKPLGRCYGDDPANCEKYGRLYTIAEAEPEWKLDANRQVVVENLCPEGWHIPSHAELATMLKFVDKDYQKGDDATGNGKNVAGLKLKTVSGWEEGTGGDSDIYGFSALPGGYCGGGCPNIIAFQQIGKMSYWWTTNVGQPAALSITWNMNSSHSVNDAMQSYPTSRFYARCMRKSGEVAPVAVASSTGKVCAEKTDYNGFGEQVKEAYPDLDLGEILAEIIDSPSSNSNGSVSPPITTSILPQLALSNISAHPMRNSIELQNLPSNAKVEIYNLQGKTIFTSGESLNRANRGSDNLRIQVHTGMYIIKVSLGSETKILRVPVM